MIDSKQVVYCDYGDCHEYLEGDYGDTADDVMCEALRRGWVFSYGLHIWANCPKHKQFVSEEQTFRIPERQKGQVE